MPRDAVLPASILRRTRTDTSALDLEVRAARPHCDGYALRDCITRISNSADRQLRSLARCLVSGLRGDGVRIAGGVGAKRTPDHHVLFLLEGGTP